MKFDELDNRMRLFETSVDYSVLPGIYMVARLDGRSFTRLTKDVQKFNAPFDEGFRDSMVKTTESLMTCGFRVSFAFTQSDEISLLFDLDEELFGRKIRKYISILAAEASACLSLLLGQAVTFDCRVSQLPNSAHVVDYFRWRNEDAVRNALNAYCYWTLRQSGFDARSSTNKLVGLSVAEKNQLLFQYGINFNNVPNWQKRGVGLYWETYERLSHNPRTSQPSLAQRRRIKRDFELPMKDEYSQFVYQFTRSVAS